MEKELAEQFTREELAAMGEEVETVQPGPETLETEEKPEVTETEHPTPELEEKPKVEDEEKPTEDKEDESEPEEGKPVHYDRFKKVYGRGKQAERERDEAKQKLDLFKRNPDEYYETYPDEKPQDYKPRTVEPEPKRPAAKLPDKPKAFSECANVVVNGGTFNGQTLAQVMEQNMAAAIDIYNKYKDDFTAAKAAERKAVEEYKNQEDAILKKIRDADVQFLNARAKELYGKDFTELSEDDPIQGKQREKVIKVGNEVATWMKKNGRLTYTLEDAFRLMNYEKTIQDAEAKGASALVDHAKRGTVKSIGSTSGSTVSDPYGKYLGMTQDALADLITNMPDEKYEEFLKKATPAFRKKFKDLPYLD